MRVNSIREPWSSRYETSRTTANAQVNQEKLLVVRDKRQYQEIHSRMYKMPIEQSIVHEEGGRTLSIGNTKEL